jgi:hypothetical protein
MLAAALVDSCDALAMAKSKSASPAVRASAALVSGLSASAELLVAQSSARFVGRPVSVHGRRLIRRAGRWPG